MRWTVALRVLLIVCLAACAQRHDSYVIENDSEKNLETFYARVREWPHAAEPQRAEAIVSNYASLNVGSGSDDVKEALGEPDVVDKVYQSDKPEKKVTSWLYVLKMSGPLNEGGVMRSAVAIYLDESDRLIAASTIGVKDGTPIGDLSAGEVGRYMSYWD